MARKKKPGIAPKGQEIVDGDGDGGVIVRDFPTNPPNKPNPRPKPIGGSNMNAKEQAWANYLNMKSKEFKDWKKESVANAKAWDEALKEERAKQRGCVGAPWSWALYLVHNKWTRWPVAGLLSGLGIWGVVSISKSNGDRKMRRKAAMAANVTNIRSGKAA